MLLECAQGDQPVRCPNKILCAPAFSSSVWWWRCGGGCVSVVMLCAVMWHVMPCGWLRGEMKWLMWLVVRWRTLLRTTKYYTSTRYYSVLLLLRTKGYFSAVHSTTASYKALQNIIPYYKVLLGTSRCYKYYFALQSSTPYYKGVFLTTNTTPYYKVFLRTTRCCKVLLHPTRYYNVLVRATRYYSVLQTTTRYYKV